MKVADYSRLAIRTAKPLPLHKQHMHFSLGIISEAGELADCIKAHAIYDKPLDVANIKEECGDMLWFLNYMSELVGNPFERFVDHAFNNAVALPAPTPMDDPTHYIELASYSMALCHYADDLVCCFYDYATSDSESQALDAIHLEAAVGDMLIGIRGILNSCGLTVGQAMQANIDKLAVRYANQIYTDGDALNRDLAAERQTLEAKNG